MFQDNRGVLQCANGKLQMWYTCSVRFIIKKVSGCANLGFSWDNLNLYGKLRTVMAADRVVMLKTLRCRVRVVWVFRTTQ